MQLPLVMTLASALLVLVLLVLFRVEAHRGARFLPRAREAFDRAVAQLLTRVGTHYPHSAFRTVRQSSHYLFHRVLTRTLALIGTLEATVRRLLHVNRRHAARARGAQTGHLTELAAHKKAAALSDEEKEQRRTDALNGT